MVLMCWMTWVARSTAATSPPPPLLTNEVSPPLQVATPQALLAPTVGVSNAPSREAQAPIDVLVPTLSAQPDTLPSIFPPWPTHQLPRSMVSLMDWANYYGVAKPRKLGTAPQSTYEIRVGDGKALIRMGSSRATVRGVDVILCHLPQFVGGEPALHWLDLLKTLHPLLWVQPPMITETNRRVVIDPGHGGRDVGTGSPDNPNFEKRMTLDWALRLRSLLEKQGYEVLLTRTNDVEISLAQRVFIAEEAQAGLFISLHFNSAYPVNGRRGLETYALTPPGLASTVVRDGEDNMRLLFPNNGHDAANLLLAWRIQRGVVATAGAVDRGVQRARFMGVLRGQKRPAVLVEGGYLSNPEEARKIGDPAYRQKLAEGVASGLKDLWVAE